MSWSLRNVCGNGEALCNDVENVRVVSVECLFVLGFERGRRCELSPEFDKVVGGAGSTEGGGENGVDRLCVWG